LNSPAPRLSGAGEAVDKLPAIVTPWFVTLSITAAATAGIPVALRACFINCEGSTVEFLPPQSGNCAICFIFIRHLDKREASCATCLTIRNHIDLQNLSERLEGRPQSDFVGPKAQISYKNILQLYSPVLCRGKVSLIQFFAAEAIGFKTASRFEVVKSDSTERIKSGGLKLHQNHQLRNDTTLNSKNHRLILTISFNQSRVPGIKKREVAPHWELCAGFLIFSLVR
jgi:hypothetical protein